MTPPSRSSGGKRTATEAAETDVLNPVPGSLADGDTAPPVAQKAKITYHLPHQNMEPGHFYVVLGEDVDVSTKRFKILSLLGEGTFGKVVEAWDRKHRAYRAVKIIRNIDSYVHRAQYEVHYMKKILDGDPRDDFAVMKLMRHFKNDAGHPCIVMPKCGPSTLEWIQRYGGLPHRHVAEIVFHCGGALDYLHSYLRLIHTDLRPKNILFESLRPPVVRSGVAEPELPCKVRICDLGGCCDERHSKNAIVSTRHYRSPEVILGLGWMFSTDMWSMGCIIYELATGRLLYDTHDNLEHLHLMEKTLTKLPAEWVNRCSDDTKPLFSGSRLKPPTDSRSLGHIGRARPVATVITEPLLLDLVLGLLHYDPRRRLTARQMMSHPYVAKHFPDSVMHPCHPSHRQGLPSLPLY